MEKLDRDMQKRVWDRVYPQTPTPRLTQQQRQALQRCLQRNESNLAFYEKMAGHDPYGDAFRRMAEEATEHSKMLRQMLQQ